VYFGQLEGYGTGIPVLKNAFYVVTRTDPEKKSVSNVLVKRGGELHSPDRMYLSPSVCTLRLVHDPAGNFKLEMISFKLEAYHAAKVGSNRFSFPTFWRYDVLRGLEYLRSAGIPPDSRVRDAIELVMKRRHQNGRWPAQPSSSRKDSIGAGHRCRQVKPLEHAARSALVRRDRYIIQCCYPTHRGWNSAKH
jgi:hypothetical protein